MAEARKGSAPNFAPPVEEGQVFSFEDEHGDPMDLEFLGLLIHEGRSYGFFFPVDEGHPAKSSGEVMILEAVAFDEDGQPSESELVCDEGILAEVYTDFVEATKDIYRFE